MSKWKFDQALTKEQLAGFFTHKKEDLRKFGSTVNQTFEAFVFASTIQWYRDNGWRIKIMNPVDKKTKKRFFKLKFSTRGEPDNFSYAVARKGNRTIQIRHQLRVATKAHDYDSKYYANVCLDIAVIKNRDLSKYKTYNAVSNDALHTFGEAKHMSGYAELIAGFVGLVHEMQPSRLKYHRPPKRKPWHVKPFLFVSGVLYSTGAGLEYTIRQRCYDIDVFTSAKGLSLRQQGAQQDAAGQPATSP